MSDATVETDATTPTDPVHIGSESEFEAVVDDHDVVLFDFYADWCGPCKMIAPIVERIAAETDAVVGKVDVDANQGLAASHGVRGVPMLSLYADGEQVQRMTGVQPEDQLRALVTQYTN